MHAAHLEAKLQVQQSKLAVKQDVQDVYVQAFKAAQVRPLSAARFLVPVSQSLVESHAVSQILFPAVAEHNPPALREWLVWVCCEWQSFWRPSSAVRSRCVAA